MKTIVALGTFLVFQVAFAQVSSQSFSRVTGVQIGQLAMGGTACPLAGADIEVRLNRGRLQIPLVVESRKASTDQIERGACAFTLPLSVDSSHRLVLSNLVALGNLNLARGTQGRVNLEVFAAGDRGETLSEALNAEQRRIYKDFSLTQEGEVVTLECGQAINLRGNASVLLQGQGRAYGNLNLIQLQARVERCP
jgi:hypothetical protein